VTRLASDERTIGPLLLHALFELPLVGIVVAAGAVENLPVVDHGWLRLKVGRFLMAVGTWNSHVPAGQDEMRLLVLGQAECRRFIALKIVTAVAGVEVRCSGKLPCVFVGVAVSTTFELDLELRVLSFRSVALRALQPRVATLQRIRALSVLFHRKL